MFRHLIDRLMVTQDGVPVRRDELKKIEEFYKPKTTVWKVTREVTKEQLLEEAKECLGRK